MAKLNLSLFGASKIPNDVRLAEKLLYWLHNKWPSTTISLPDMYQAGPNELRHGKEARRISEILQEHGWLVRLDGVHVLDGQRRREVWRIIR